MARLQDWKEKARRLRRDARALFYALGDRRVPWYARALAGAVVAYAVSPIDLIPDFIPVLGLLDDLLLIPAGLYLVFRLVPAEVMADCRARAQQSAATVTQLAWIAAALIVLLWIGIAALVIRWIV